MDDSSSETEKLLPSFGGKKFTMDSSNNLVRINRKDQSSSEYDDEDDDNFDDENDKLIQSDRLTSSSSSDEGRNQTKKEVMSSTKDIASLNYVKSSNKNHINEAIERSEEIDITVDKCQLRDDREDNNELTDDKSNASGLASVEYAKSTPLNDEMVEFECYPGSIFRHDDESTATVNDSNVENLENFVEIVQTATDESVNLNRSANRRPSESYIDKHKQDQKLLCENNYCEDHIAGANYRFNIGLEHMEEQQSHINNYDMTHTFVYDDKSDKTEACDMNNCNTFKCFEKSAFLEDNGSTIASHPDTVEIPKQQLLSGQVEIEKFYPDGANNTSMRRITENLQRRRQTDNTNDFTCMLSCDNCVDVPENDTEKKMFVSKDFPQNIETNFSSVMHSLKVCNSEVPADEEKNKHPVDEENLKLPNNNLSSKTSLDYVLSVGDKYSDKVIPNRVLHDPPNSEITCFESSKKEEASSSSLGRYTAEAIQCDQVVSESLRNQLNRFDLLINTLDQRNTRNMAENAAERGYWSTIFGQASEIEAYDEISSEKKAHRALELLEDYHSRLSEPQDRALRIAIERVIRIFKSRLFQALLGRKSKNGIRFNCLSDRI